MYPTGAPVDRFHPLRVMLVAKIGFCLAVSVKFVFLFHGIPKPVVFLDLSQRGSTGHSDQPRQLGRRTSDGDASLPTRKFGQFCSANAICTALRTIVGGILAGSLLGGLKTVFKGGDYYYRFVPICQVAFTLLALGMMVLVFQEWKRLGGDKSFSPPTVDRFAAADAHQLYGKNVRPMPAHHSVLRVGIVGVGGWGALHQRTFHLG